MPSASATLANKELRRHELQVNVSTLAVAATLVTPQALPSFAVGGRHRRVWYYPGGDRAESAGYVSLYLGGLLQTGRVRARGRAPPAISAELFGVAAVTRCQSDGAGVEPRVFRALLRFAYSATPFPLHRNAVDEGAEISRVATSAE